MANTSFNDVGCISKNIHDALPKVKFNLSKELEQKFKLEYHQLSA